MSYLAHQTEPTTFTDLDQQCRDSMGTCDACHDILAPGHPGANLVEPARVLISQFACIAAHRLLGTLSRCSGIVTWGYSDRECHKYPETKKYIGDESSSFNGLMSWKLVCLLRIKRSD